MTYRFNQGMGSNAEASGRADLFPRRVLVGFAPVWLEVGESTTVTVEGSTRRTNRRAEDGFVPVSPSVIIEAAAFSGDEGAATTTVEPVT